MTPVVKMSVKSYKANSDIQREIADVYRGVANIEPVTRPSGITFTGYNGMKTMSEPSMAEKIIASK